MNKPAFFEAEIATNPARHSNHLILAAARLDLAAVVVLVARSFAVCAARARPLGRWRPCKHAHSR